MKIQQKTLFLGTHEVSYFSLSNDLGMTVELMNWGATLINIAMPDKHGLIESVTLAYEDINRYESNEAYFGSIVGRVAGRIANGRFHLTGQNHILSANSGKHHLHGGAKAMHQQLWQVEEVLQTKDFLRVRMSYLSSAGENLYPGNLKVNVSYTLSAKNVLSIVYHAATDAPTLCNLTNHAYFNLSGNTKRTVEQHFLHVDATDVCAMSDDLIVTGNLWSVSNSPFDFRNVKQITTALNSNDRRIALAKGIDHYFVLNPVRAKKPQVVLWDEVSGRRLSVLTDQPCAVLYTHNYANNEALRDGVLAKPYDALCIETQKLPHLHSENGDHPAALYPTQEYTQHTEFCFDIMQQ